jgi:hypothetical protein
MHQLAQAALMARPAMLAEPMVVPETPQALELAVPDSLEMRHYLVVPAVQTIPTRL